MPDPLDHPEPTPQWQAVSYHHNALNAYEEAYELSRLAFRVSHLTIPRSDLTPEVNAQRKAIMDLAVKIIHKDRDRLMDRVVELWTTYREMNP